MRSRALVTVVFAVMMVILGGTAAQAATYLRCCYSTLTACNTARAPYVKDGSWNVASCKYYTFSDGSRRGYGFTYSTR